MAVILTLPTIYPYLFYRSDVAFLSWVSAVLATEPLHRQPLRLYNQTLPVPSLMSTLPTKSKCPEWSTLSCLKILTQAYTIPGIYLVFTCHRNEALFSISF